MIICLIGYMASGKSTLGEKLSDKLDLPFIDMDTYIEEKVGKSIPVIFEEYGEYYFRKIEKFSLKELLQKQDFIIATGGGTPTFYDNMKLINQLSSSFYLKLDASVLIARLEKEKEKRPLVKEKSGNVLVNFVKNQLQEREVYYKQAEFTIENNDIDRCLDEILTRIKD